MGVISLGGRGGYHKVRERVEARVGMSLVM